MSATTLVIISKKSLVSVVLRLVVFCRLCLNGDTTTGTPDAMLLLTDAPVDVIEGELA